MSQRHTITGRVLAVLGFCCLILWTLGTIAPALGSLLGSVKSQTEIVAEPLSCRISSCSITTREPGKAPTSESRG